MFKEMLSEIPTSFKVLWIGGLAVSAGLTGFAVWAVYTVVIHVTAGP